jgi:hypothetical protein
MPASLPSNLVKRVGFDYRQSTVVGSYSYHGYWETVSASYSAVDGFTSENPSSKWCCCQQAADLHNWLDRDDNLWLKQLQSSQFQMVFDGLGTDDFCIDFLHNKRYDTTTPIVKFMLPNNASGQQNWIELVAVNMDYRLQIMA